MGREYVMVSCEEYDSLTDSAAKLRERYAELWEKYNEVCQTSAMLRADMAAARERQAKLRAENAELRELAERAWKTAERLCQAFDGPCRDDGVTIYKPCPMGERDEECVYGQLQRELQERGVEVDA